MTVRSFLTPCSFATDPVLIAQGARTDYFKTGHSYIKRRVKELSALAGFEKSEHFFFNAPIGRGYDDGMVHAVDAVLRKNPDAAPTIRRLKRRHAGPRR
jgi:phosphomannomutase/phosphoglucomutase